MERRRFTPSFVSVALMNIAKVYRPSSDDFKRRQKRLRSKYGWSYPSNGSRERRRRVWQIECGQLKRENGLTMENN